MGILDAPAKPARQLVPVATRCVPPTQSGNGLSDGIMTGGTARLQHTLVRTCHGLRLVYSNHYATSGFVEASGPNVITVKAAIEYPATVIFPVTFQGQDSVEIAPGANVVSDPIGLELAKGLNLYTRTYVAVNGGEYFLRGGMATGGSGGPEGHNYANPPGADLTATGSGNPASGYNEYVYGPSAILGYPTDPGKVVIGGVGDSILAGTGDNQVGWLTRLVNGDYSLQKVAYPGEGIGTGWNNLNGLQRYRRMALLEQVGANLIVAEHIVNDLGNPLATLQSNALTYWTALSRLGPVWATTCTPQTTGDWTTTVGQTIANSSKETKRVQYNAWLRDGAPISAGVAVAVGTLLATRAGASGHPLRGYIEVTDQLETARDSGIWKANYTADGTHPTTAGATAIAAALNPVTYFGARSAT